MPTITVTNTSDAGAGSLRQAVLDSVAGDIIDFDAAVVTAGIIALTSGHIEINKSIWIQGPGSADLSISSAGARVFFASAQIPTISGLTLGPSTSIEGGILRNETTLSLSDVIFASGSSDYGAAIYNSSTILMQDCVVQDGVSSVDGGGIWNSGTLTAFNLTVSGCQAEAGDGGGIWNSGTMSIVGGLISTNFAFFSGGGAFNSGTLTITQVTVDANNCNDDGAGLDTYIGTTTIIRSTISNNTGEGVFNNTSTVAIDNSTISGNDAALTSATGGATEILHSTITRNTVGINLPSGCILSEIQNTILAGNTGSDLVAETADVTSGGYNLFGTTSNPITPGTGDSFDVTWGDLLIGLLADNGGPTFTHALTTASPAKDAGTDIDAPPTDQRGEPRIVGLAIDIGAYEMIGSGGTVCVASGTYSQTMVGANPTQIAVVKAALNAQALAAATALIPTECGEAGSCVNTPNYENIYYDSLNLTDAVESPNDPGHYTHEITFAGRKGDYVAIWMGSETFDTRLYLTAPDTTVIASDIFGVGYLYTAPKSSAALMVQLPETGTYSIDCTSYDPAITGEFRLMISHNRQNYVEFGPGTNNAARALVYVPSLERLFLGNQVGMNSGGVYQVMVCDACSMAPLKVLQWISGAGFPNCLAMALNTQSGLIYVLQSDGELATIDPATYVVTIVASGVCNPNSNGQGMVYDPVNNRLFISVEATLGYPTNGVRVIDCDTDTVIDFVDMGGDVGWISYSSLGYCYVSVLTEIKKLNTTTLAITATGIACDSKSKTSIVNEKNLLFYNIAGVGMYGIADLTTDTEVDTKRGTTIGVWDAIYNPITDLIYVSCYADPSAPTYDFGAGISLYDSVNKVIVGFLTMGKTYDIVYSPEIEACYVAQGDNAGIYQIH